ncbi:hypothetical protein PLEOSDRAFT_1109169 [Pleurotus ostreatus PC15]|uniref:Uncharacterized protein n=1 Tax=Pleurotus ostreatus (strain PC15) TaxID=1137138 RepID=A0A067N1Z8_PLEO1|nr:hypothetical protein PLEOSDRAFT_1109169 [Pleurotus ostreatus PC15]
MGSPALNGLNVQPRLFCSLSQPGNATTPDKSSPRQIPSQTWTTAAGSLNVDNGRPWTAAGHERSVVSRSHFPSPSSPLSPHLTPDDLLDSLGTTRAIESGKSTHIWPVLTAQTSTAFHKPCHTMNTAQSLVMGHNMQPTHKHAANTPYGHPTRPDAQAGANTFFNIQNRHARPGKCCSSQNGSGNEGGEWEATNKYKWANANGVMEKRSTQNGG